MQRTIKFRAWDKKYKEFIGEDQFYIYPNGIITAWDEDGERFLEDVILMQYTGLKDKNGKEIYEGDILKWGNTVSFVVWCLDSWRFNSYMEQGTSNLYDYVNTTTKKEIAEVIGNIYENPELLK